MSTKEKRQYANMTFPPGFANPYTFTDKNGQEWEKAICSIPNGYKANGIDIGGYAVDIFVSDKGHTLDDGTYISSQKEQIASGEPLRVGFPADEKVELFMGKGEERKSLRMDPWQLATAMKEGREAYAAAKEAERAAERAGQSLDDKGKELGKVQEATQAASTQAAPERTQVQGK